MVLTSLGLGPLLIGMDVDGMLATGLVGELSEVCSIDSLRHRSHHRIDDTPTTNNDTTTTPTSPNNVTPSSPSNVSGNGRLADEFTARAVSRNPETAHLQGSHTQLVGHHAVAAGVRLW